MNAVAEPEKWHMQGPVCSGRNRLIDSESRAFVSSFTGSLSRGAPCGMAADVAPAKRTGRGWPSGFPSGPASTTVAAPIFSGLSPYSLLRRRRISLPPTLRRMTCRTVWFSKERPPTTGIVGDAPQAPAHPGGGSFAGGVSDAGVVEQATRARASAIPDRRFIRCSPWICAILAPGRMDGRRGGPEEHGNVEFCQCYLRHLRWSVGLE